MQRGCIDHDELIQRQAPAVAQHPSGESPQGGAQGPVPASHDQASKVTTFAGARGIDGFATCWHSGENIPKDVA